MAVNNDRTKKPIRVGGDTEFGEKYHVAVALLREPSLTAVILGPDRHRAGPFLSLWAKGRVTHVEKDFEKKDYQGTGTSTDIYCANWSRDEASEWRKTILDSTLARYELVKQFLNRKLGSDRKPAALVWLRNDNERNKERNSTRCSVEQICEVVQTEGFRAILIGDDLNDGVPETPNLLRFYADHNFCSDDSICTQLLMFDLLIQNHGVRCSIGMKSGGMDGPGLFFGLPTISFTFRRNSSRVQKIKQTIGNFDLILLDGSHKGTFKKHTLPELEKLRRLLREWGEIDRQTECASS